MKLFFNSTVYVATYFERLVIKEVGNSLGLFIWAELDLNAIPVLLNAFSFVAFLMY